MNKFFNQAIFKKDWFWLIVITATALILRLWFVRFFGGFTFDEIVSFSVAQKPLGQIWSYVRWEMHPPLHFYYLHFWLQFFGQSEISARLSSVFLSILAVITFYFLGKEVFKTDSAGLFAASLYALSPFFCFLDIWARMYAMLFLAATLSFLFFLKFIKVSGKRGIIFGALYTFFTLTALFTHLTAGLIITVEAVYLAFLFFTRQSTVKEILKKFFIPAFIVLLTYGAWFWYFLNQRLSALNSSAWYFNTKGEASFIAFLYYGFIKYLTLSDFYFSELLAFSMAVILLFFALVAIKRNGKGGLKIRSRFSNGTFFSLLIFILSFGVLVVTKLLVLRYAIIPEIGFFLLLGYGFSVADRFWQTLIFAMIIVMSAIYFLTILGMVTNTEDWKVETNFINQNERPGDKIIASLNLALLPLDFYYHGVLPAAAPLDEKYRGDDLLLTVIKTNTYPTTNKNNISQLDNFLGSSSRVFLIICDGAGAFPGNSRIAEDWLAAKGFVKAQQCLIAGGCPPYVLLMEKTNPK